MKKRNRGPAPGEGAVLTGTITGTSGKDQDFAWTFRNEATSMLSVTITTGTVRWTKRQSREHRERARAQATAALAAGKSGPLEYKP